MKSILLKTPLPGPVSQALLDRRNNAVPRGISYTFPIFASRAEGAILEDVDGNRFIDLAGGIGCLNAGHRPKAVVDAIQRQADRYLHTCFMVTPYEPYVRLAEKLNELAPGPGPKKTALFNSGAEAVENGVKIARAYTGRPAIICFEHAFHGRTLLGMSLTSETHPYKSGFGPFASEIYRIPFASCYRCSYSLRYPACEAHCAHVLEDAFKTLVAAESVAAVIVEPVLGEGGFHVPPIEFFTVLQQICRKHGILIVADEVQTGFARTGYMFACEYFGLEPDLLLTAKTLGGGLPLAAVTGAAEIMDHTTRGSLGGTFGGNPLACEAALATLETIEDRQLCNRANVLGERFQQHALKWQRQCSFIGDVRGLGAMQAIEFVRDRESRAPAAEFAKQVAQFCFLHGVIVLTAGTHSSILRLLMPLTISDDEFEEALQILQAGLTWLCGANTPPASSVTRP
jgi:4-aminobutyrate aminotransferase/(S)-3-amino-2-methylpropionate transaminase